MVKKSEQESEPAFGAAVLDGNGVVWQRHQEGWVSTKPILGVYTWDGLHIDRGPVVVLHTTG